MPPLLVKKIHQDAQLPTYGSEGAIGLDLYAAHDLVLGDWGDHDTVRTGISIAIPHGYYGRIAPRSGLAARHAIDVLAGVVDEDYRGEIKVLLINHGPKSVEIKKGDRVAQLILERADRPQVIEVETLKDTERGSKGYGSTGR